MSQHQNPINKLSSIVLFPNIINLNNNNTYLKIEDQGVISIDFKFHMQFHCYLWLFLFPCCSFLCWTFSSKIWLDTWNVVDYRRKLQGFTWHPIIYRLSFSSEVFPIFTFFYVTFKKVCKCMSLWLFLISSLNE